MAVVELRQKLIWTWLSHSNLKLFNPITDSDGFLLRVRPQLSSMLYLHPSRMGTATKALWVPVALGNIYNSNKTPVPSITLHSARFLLFLLQVF
ncbi:hypothetical protein PGT21_018181 [Puccinia graminis f. sp. tritici]|uniref:Uncharacterized protein n=1 Tax=Puccinia graminis f. sp. tritici TaxID=56615 RepID=A0A5B0M493_PUCGR|nr:hypothetical protein PGT21_018181 [Puccinia graminis f. sp. tritici]KAA1089781.1 hypothetical protein PGTUg99_010574 [Puccinia graminis f. sp. tritici]